MYITRTINKVPKKFPASIDYKRTFLAQGKSFVVQLSKEYRINKEDISQ